MRRERNAPIHSLALTLTPGGPTAVTVLSAAESWRLRYVPGLDRRGGPPGVPLSRDRALAPGASGGVLPLIISTAGAVAVIAVLTDMALHITRLNAAPAWATKHVSLAGAGAPRAWEASMFFAPNLSMLWADLPLPERFERAARAGFGAVELWWPGADAELLPGLTSRWGLRLALLNFDGGDLAVGDRGLAADPRRREQLRAHVPAALKIAQTCGCRRLNLLIGLRQERYSLTGQLECARDNVTWAADRAAQAGCEVMIEAINTIDNGPYLLTTTAAAAAFAREVDRPNVRLQYDVYNMQRMEGDITSTLDRYWDLISHIQIADAPGRNEPGTGEINYRHVLDHLARKGYQGAVGLEYRPRTGRPEDSFGWLSEYGLVRRI
ncbi:MAG: hydroxypyruvate isomerase family protein [Streptosporangiaceae bacterium]|jgi:hydroxypyruvate isomerase